MSNRRDQNVLPSGSRSLSGYAQCLAIARRHARNEADAADLLHEALLVAVQAGRGDFSSPGERAWLAGVMRKMAAMTARTAGRRRQRESKWAEVSGFLGDELQETAPDRASILAGLSEGTRRVAVLALHGMNQDEIRYVLELEPAAFRQRLTALRRALGKLPGPLRSEALALAYARPRREGEERLDFGLIRRALLHHVRGSDELGTHDPDGHLIGIRHR
ncbi:MAG: sigma-70 family RNA polymerase sigma factor [Xanthomonadales bacterium]|nr:sigma-70 family RNA polymerase sigma factor [Xanthomonadales bacterium]